MPAPDPPYLMILARRTFGWYPCLEFTIQNDREAFLRIAERLVEEFAGKVVERYGGDGPADKEYWWIDLEAKRQLLMRKETPIGIGLVGNDRTDIDLFVKIAERFAVRSIGWRWCVWRMWRWAVRPQRDRVG